MKIYTGGGDQGNTSLFSGERVPKNDPRVEAYGDVDELNAAVGLLAAFLQQADIDAGNEIPRIQQNLLLAGAWLSTAPGSSFAQHLAHLPQEEIGRLETAIDRLSAGLPPLRHFILPGGNPPAAMAHLCRTICRRAERRVVALQNPDAAQAGTETHRSMERRLLVYLNRLSDYFFVLARTCNLQGGVAEQTWE